MAVHTPTTYARDWTSESYARRAIERHKTEVDICRYRFGVLLLDMARAVAAEPVDEARVADLAQDIVDAECALSRAREDLADAEEGA